MSERDSQPTFPTSKEQVAAALLRVVNAPLFREADARPLMREAAALLSAPETKPEPRRVNSVMDFKVTVCSECLQASCWLGEFYCEKYRDASTVEKTVRELHALGPLEDPGYWFKSPSSGKVNQKFREAYESALKAPAECDECEGSGESSHTWHDGTQYSTKEPPCPACNGSGLKTGADV